MSAWKTAEGASIQTSKHENVEWHYRPIDISLSNICSYLYGLITDRRPSFNEYSETVRDLAAKNAHWRYYDENFRFLRQKTLFPWDQIHWELWLQAHHMQKSPTVVSSDSRNRPTRSPFPSGFCWRFHRGEKCSGCNFKHECFRCGSHHPANQCHFPKQQANSTKAVPRPKSTAVTANNSAPTSRTVSSIGNANQNR